MQNTLCKGRSERKRLANGRTLTIKSASFSRDRLKGFFYRREHIQLKRTMYGEVEWKFGLISSVNALSWGQHIFSGGWLRLRIRLKVDRISGAWRKESRRFFFNLLWFPRSQGSEKIQIYQTGKFKSREAKMDLLEVTCLQDATLWTEVYVHSHILYSFLLKETVSAWFYPPFTLKMM